MKKTKRIYVLTLIVSVFICIVLISGCKKGKTVEDKTIRIGAILPLTGPSSTLGVLHKYGMEIAVKEINENNYLNRKLEIIYEDSKNEAKTGINAFNKLLLDKVPAVIATFSNVSVPLASYMATKKEDEVPVLLVTAVSAPKITLKHSKVFRAFITSDVESKEISKFLIERENYKKAAVYYVDDDYGKGAENVFSNQFEDQEAGRQIVFSEGFKIGQSDHRTAAIKIKSASPDIVFVIGYERDFASAIKQIREAKIEADIITTAPLAIPQNMNAAGDTNGIFLTTSRFDSKETKSLSEKFKEEFEKEYNMGTNYQSASTYLCVQLIAQAFKSVGYSSDSVKKGLLKVQNFPSPLGNISIDSNREGSFPVEVKQIINGKISSIINSSEK